MPVDGAVLFGEARVVGDLLRVDPHEVLVVEEKFGAEFEVGVLEVAEPCVAGLVPDLDRLEVEFGGLDNRATLALQAGDGEVDLAEVGVGSEDERARLVFALGGDDSDGLALQTVNRRGVRHVLPLGHRVDGIPCYGRLRREGRNAYHCGEAGC